MIKENIIVNEKDQSLSFLKNKRNRSDNQKKAQLSAERTKAEKAQKNNTANKTAN